eukprot:gene18004-21442_t
MAAMSTRLVVSRRFAFAVQAIFVIKAAQALDNLDNTATLRDDIKTHSMIRVVNGTFVKGCRQFRIIGWNSYKLLEAGADIDAGRAQVDAILDEAVSRGFNTLRTWAHSVDQYVKLQESPNKYSEYAFKGLDYVLDAARKRHLKVILVFTNYWKDEGGIPEYVRWSTTATQNVDFYNDSECRQMYVNHVEKIITRINHISGTIYRNDPTIMAWELCNEPRCRFCKPAQLQEWIRIMSLVVKRLDPNHLLTVGEEGFYKEGSTGTEAINPGLFGYESGQDFIENHIYDEIDYVTFHM